ncbi:hypothetical protein ABIF99_001000 [Bradyrhizobium japonicum]|nr:hypothetical protein [Bradyrhizobium japonicum]MCP1865695.1 hypothetical protein [Bradyrhizobium japonicum]MCP1895534.1 hypothetical protein [Bradyrhizobium japonicum]MCW2328917.1 hypothetical protein [Bradyrhizobium japonicum]
MSDCYAPDPKTGRAGSANTRIHRTEVELSVEHPKTSGSSSYFGSLYKTVPPAAVRRISTNSIDDWAWMLYVGAAAPYGVPTGAQH